MKKQISKRLTLHRETVRRISGAEAARAFGGETGTETQTCITCVVNCLTRVTCTW
jgi:hypothetical protein